jgi:CheY-like chemotaxis protein
MARVLFIEDDPSWQEILRELLETAGHEAQRANTIESAMGILRGKQKFDTVVFDLRLGAKALGDDPFVWLDALVDGLKARKLRVPPIIIVTGVDVTTQQVARSFTQFRGIVFSFFEKKDLNRKDFMQSIKDATNHPRPRSSLQLLASALLMSVLVVSTFAILLWSVGQIPNPQTQQVLLQTGGALIVVIVIFVAVFSQNAKLEDVIESISKIWRG